MKRIILAFFISAILTNTSCAQNATGLTTFAQNREERAVKNLLNSQVKYANKANLNKFISTYDKDYINGDGFNLETYSKLVQDIWKNYDNIKYGIKIKNIKVEDDKATAELIETTHAIIPLKNTVYYGELNSESDSVYNLEKKNGKWKVVSDKVVDETTSMMYGEAKYLDIKLTVPLEIEPNTEYSATLEFTPPKETLAIASIASDLIEYPQKQAVEVFRALPEDHVLERLFTSNTKNLNEYIVASIGLTKTDICDLSVKLNLTGFGYTIRRVNVVPSLSKENTVNENKDVEKQ